MASRDQQSLEPSSSRKFGKGFNKDVTNSGCRDGLVSKLFQICSSHLCIRNSSTGSMSAHFNPLYPSPFYSNKSTIQIQYYSKSAPSRHQWMEHDLLQVWIPLTAPNMPLPLACDYNALPNMVSFILLTLITTDLSSYSPDHCIFSSRGDSPSICCGANWWMCRCLGSCTILFKCDTSRISM